MIKGKLRNVPAVADDGVVIDLDAPEESRLPRLFCAGCGRLTPALARFCPYCAVAIADDVEAAGEPEVVAAEAVPEPPVAGQRRLRRSLIVGLVLAVTVGVAGGGGVLTQRGGEPGYDPAAGVVLVGDAVAKPWELAKRAATLAQLRAAGEAAASARGAIEGELAAVEEVGDAQLRGALRRAFSANLELLAVVAGLSQLDTAAADEWQQIAVDARAQLKELDVAVASITAVDDALAADALVDPVSDGIGALELLLGTMSDKVAAWEAERVAVRAERQAAQAALDGYVSAFNVEIERYSGLRQELGNYIEGFANTTFNDDYAFFGAAVAKRQEVRGAMSALTPPPALVAGHTAVLGIVDASVSAVNDARRGLEQFQYEYYESWEFTPGWQSFTSKSNEISEGWTSAVSTWQKQVADEQARINALRDPAKPTL